jgi:hypothetical protein
MLADTTAQAGINMAAVQHELRDNELIQRDYGHLKYRKIDDPRSELTLESDEDWQKTNCVLDNGVRILARSRGQKVRGLKHRQHRPALVVADDVVDLEWVRTHMDSLNDMTPSTASRGGSAVTSLCRRSLSDTIGNMSVLAHRHYESNPLSGCEPGMT